jgi:hypothetical protein
MFSRRELLQGIGTAPLTSLPLTITDKTEALRQAIEELKARILRDFPDIKCVHIAFDPENAAVPFMVTAFRV